MRRFLAGFLAVLAVGVAAAGIWLALANRDAEAVLVREDPAARAAAVAVLDAVSAGDYEAAGSMMLGMPSLGVDRQAGGAVGVLLWEAYRESLTFTPAGEGYATQSGVAFPYTVRYLDLSSVTGSLRQRSQTLLEQRVAEASDVSEIYDENNDYREDFVMAVLYDAACQALRDDAVYVQNQVSVQLVFRDGKWWVVADESLLKAISAELVG